MQTCAILSKRVLVSCIFTQQNSSCSHCAVPVSTRGTPWVQFANIRKMVLCQGLPHCLRLCFDPYMACHAQSLNWQLKSTCLTAKFGSFLDHAETVDKGQNVIILLSNIRFLWFLQSMFLLSYLYQWCGFCWQSGYAEICDHSLFTLQFRQIEK